MLLHHAIDDQTHPVLDAQGHLAASVVERMARDFAAQFLRASVTGAPLPGDRSLLPLSPKHRLLNATERKKYSLIQRPDEEDVKKYLPANDAPPVPEPVAGVMTERDHLPPGKTAVDILNDILHAVEDETLYPQDKPHSSHIDLHPAKHVHYQADEALQLGERKFYARTHFKELLHQQEEAIRIQMETVLSHVDNQAQFMAAHREFDTGLAIGRQLIGEVLYEHGFSNNQIAQLYEDFIAEPIRLSLELHASRLSVDQRDDFYHKFQNCMKAYQAAANPAPSTEIYTVTAAQQQRWAEGEASLEANGGKLAPGHAIRLSAEKKDAPRGL